MPCQSSLTSLLLMRLDLGVWDTLKLQRRKESLEQRVETESWNREFRPFCVSSRVSKNTKGYSATWVVQSVRRDREKHSESVREWKRKMRHFFFTQVTHKEDKLVEFSWSFWVLQSWRDGVFKRRFCYWLCSEIIFTSWDLFVVYQIYCGLKFSINLIFVISIS